MAFGLAWAQLSPAGEFSGHRSPVTAVAYSPDGRTLALAADLYIQLYQGYTLKRTLRGHTDTVRSLAVN
ncbi:UNVERIFIED_CONTAM: hypothetical protein IGO34_26060, partial [Salmonella enterica subsp. enterica serovar Weltevreden]